MKYIICIVLYSSSNLVHAQCLSGNCKNGEGKFDFGYAVYTGGFKNGKPDGNGKMDYGAGEIYTGNFTAGLEDGKGILIKNGQQKEVTYAMGRIMETKEKPLPVGANKQIAEGCKAGDCFEGEGMMHFKSGNKYTGNFKAGHFHGKGKMVFAGGNILEAEFVNHIPTTGTLYYAHEKVMFTGTFNADGTPNAGTYNRPDNGSIVTVNNGTITSVKNPRQDSIRASQPQLVLSNCPLCNGKGFLKSTGSSTTVGGVGKVGVTGYVDWERPPQSVTSSRASYSTCSHCKGTGKIERYKK